MTTTTDPMDVVRDLHDALVAERYEILLLLRAHQLPAAVENGLMSRYDRVVRTLAEARRTVEQALMVPQIAAAEALQEVEEAEERAALEMESERAAQVVAARRKVIESQRRRLGK
jgi:hypothetical protein